MPCQFISSVKFNWPVWVILGVLVTPLVLYNCFVSCVPRSFSLPAEKINGKYNGYELEVTDIDTVAVLVLVREPEAYLNALSDGIKKAEEKSGRKAVMIWPGPYNRTFIVLQESAESPKTD